MGISRESDLSKLYKDYCDNFSTKTEGGYTQRAWDRTVGNGSVPPEWKPEVMTPEEFRAFLDSDTPVQGLEGIYSARVEALIETGRPVEKKVVAA